MEKRIDNADMKIKKPVGGRQIRNDYKYRVDNIDII